MSQVFISFRSDDEPYAALLLQTVLSGWFGPESVFRSSDCIAPGDDYVQALVRAVRSCDVLLAVIGKRWLAPSGIVGSRSLDRPDDWVFRELAIAFTSCRRVIPVLLGDVRMPREYDLPPGIAALARCQYRCLDYRQFWAGMRLLAADLATLVPTLEHNWQRATELNISRRARDCSRRCPNVDPPAAQAIDESARQTP